MDSAIFHELYNFKNRKENRPHWQNFSFSVQPELPFLFSFQDEPIKNCILNYDYIIIITMTH